MSLSMMRMPGTIRGALASEYVMGDEHGQVA